MLVVVAVVAFLLTVNSLLSSQGLIVFKHF